MKSAAVVAAVILVLGALECGNKYLSIRSDLLAQRREARDEWANVNRALGARANLIADFATKHGLGDYAAVASQEIASARAVLTSGRPPEEKLAANDRLSAALSGLMADANGNRRLQADPSFAQWKDELANCDNEVAVLRSRYNRVLEKYNARIQQFPESLVASLAGFRRNDAYFKTDQGLFETPNR